MPKKPKKSRKPSSLIGSTAFRKLYDAALHILTLQPWNYFTSGDFFIQYPKNSERMIFANCNNKLSIQLARSLLFEEDPAQLRREP